MSTIGLALAVIIICILLASSQGGSDLLGFVLICAAVILFIVFIAALIYGEWKFAIIAGISAFGCFWIAGLLCDRVDNWYPLPCERK